MSRQWIQLARALLRLVIYLGLLEGAAWGWPHLTPALQRWISHLSVVAVLVWGAGWVGTLTLRLLWPPGKLAHQVRQSQREC